MRNRACDMVVLSKDQMRYGQPIGEAVVMVIACAAQVAIFSFIREFGWQLAASALSVPVILFVFGVEQRAVSVLTWFIPLMVFFSAWPQYGLVAGIVLALTSFGVVTFAIFPLYIWARAGLSISKLKARPLAAPPRHAPGPSTDELYNSLQAHLEAARRQAAESWEGNHNVKKGTES
jgi:hypothetical protein